MIVARVVQNIHPAVVCGLDPRVDPRNKSGDDDGDVAA
jgi:hypothetical protein